MKITSLSRQNTVIDPKNEMSYTMWKDVPVPFFMSVYFFHILNPKEILSGEKPMVEQRGPYVYRYSIQIKDAPIVSYLTRAVTVSVHFVLQPVKMSQDQLIVSALTFVFVKQQNYGSLKSVKMFLSTLHTLFLYRTSLNVSALAIRFLLSEVKPCLCV